MCAYDCTCVCKMMKKYKYDENVQVVFQLVTFPESLKVEALESIRWS